MLLQSQLHLMISQSHEEEQSAGTERSNASVASNKRSLEEMQAGERSASDGTASNTAAAAACAASVASASPKREDKKEEDSEGKRIATEAVMGLFMLGK